MKGATDGRARSRIAALIRAARSVRRRAHAPYSGFRVGAAALTSSGAIVTGCNVENASYGLSICAERAAIHRAVAEGHRQVVAVAVSAGRDGAMPCGACRQVMAEFGVREVIVDRARGAPRLFTLSELLVYPFRGDMLPRRKAQSRLP
jgi:cytidine deaminase